MPKRTDIAYLYDGSYEGFLCCVFESFEKQEIPSDILAEDGAQLSLFPARAIPTDASRASRVAASIPRRISREAEEFVYVAFHTCLNCREIRLLAFLRLGYKAGPAVMHMLADETIAQLFAAVRHAQNEAHLLSGFIRFADCGGLLAATIAPKNRVLPLLAEHFAGRYSACPILIFDETHAQALVAEGGRWRIAPLANFTPPPPGAKEREIRALWRAFYDAIAIEGRRNERCRMSHMPKRYWAHMTEFAQDDAVAAEESASLPAPTPGESAHEICFHNCI